MLSKVYLDTYAGREAGDAFNRCADLQKSGTVKHEAATNYINAAGAYKKVWAEGAYFEIRRTRVIINHFYLCVFNSYANGTIQEPSRR